MRTSMADTSASADHTCLSRSTGLPPSLGKATSELKAKVPDRVKDDFTRLARSLGLNESELLRDMVLVRLYGAEQVMSMQKQRLLMVAGTGAPIGPETEEQL
jgi:hypothetical protein